PAGVRFVLMYRKPSGCSMRKRVGPLLHLGPSRNGLVILAVACYTANSRQNLAYLVQLSCGHSRGLWIFGFKGDEWGFASRATNRMATAQTKFTSSSTIWREITAERSRISPMQSVAVARATLG